MYHKDDGAGIQTFCPVGLTLQIVKFSAKEVDLSLLAAEQYVLSQIWISLHLFCY